MILNDPFDTRPFENQAKHSFCNLSLSIKVKVHAIRDDLTKYSGKKADSKVLDKCLDCEKQFPSCAVCLKTVTVLNPMKDFMKLS